jgi:hypothetical protein
VAGLCAALLDSNGLQDLSRGEKRVKRGEKRSSVADDREVANSTRTTPGSVRVVTRKPLSRNTWSIRWFCGSTSALSTATPAWVGRIDELAEQDGAEPVVLHGVGDREGDLGALGPVGFPFPAGVGDHPTVGAGGDQAVAVLVDLGGPADRAVEVGEAAEEPQHDRLR